MQSRIAISLLLLIVFAACSSPQSPNDVSEVTQEAGTAALANESDSISPESNERIEDDTEYLIRQSVPIDGIRPIYEPEFLPAQEAPLDDGELVIGVAWGGEAKAYPVTVLRFREIVNDFLAGDPILVTFCPLCYTGLVHDRRIDNEIVFFGNYGGLFMSAMTWYDHKSNSVWSQPWGRAIEGEMKGVVLRLLPSQMTTWGQWKEDHPNSLAMVNDYARLGSGRLEFWEGFVVGINLAESDKAYYYEDLAKVGILNDEIAGVPILLWAGENTYESFARTVEGMTLSFSVADGLLTDSETGSLWNPSTGLAISGPLEGQALLAIPSSTSFDWAWLDFFPDSELYRPD